MNNYIQLQIGGSWKRFRTMAKDWTPVDNVQSTVRPTLLGVADVTFAPVSFKEWRGTVEVPAEQLEPFARRILEVDGDPLPEEEKERRKEYVMEVQRGISLEKNESRIGTKVRAVIERKEEGSFVGRTEWDAPEIDNELFLPAASPVKIGDFVEVKITDATEYDLYGEVVKQTV